MSLMKVSDIGTWGDDYIAIGYFNFGNDNYPRLSEEYWEKQLDIRKFLNGDECYCYFQFFTKRNTDNYLDFIFKSSVTHMYTRTKGMCWLTDQVFPYSTYTKYSRTWSKL